MDQGERLARLEAIVEQQGRNTDSVIKSVTALSEVVTVLSTNVAVITSGLKSKERSQMVRGSIICAVIGMIASMAPYIVKVAG